MAVKKACSAVALSLIAIGRCAVQIIEPANFNVTDALLVQGVDVTALPGLSAFANQREETTAIRSLSKGCSVVCNSLKTLYGPNNTLFRDTADFAEFTSSYWSDNQAQVSPACIFRPTTAKQVSVTVLLSRLTQCPFAAKSGGHAAFAGASSVQDGITISFANLNDIKISADKAIASIGPGNVWGAVYEELAKSDVTVIGGRLYNIGVGGLTTGGGISYWSNQYGWACDNVESYDVVTASGVVVRASETENADLFWALRGGGNNFGLVVNFNLRTVPLPGGNMWGGMRTYAEDKFEVVENAYVNMIANSPSDDKAGLWLVYGYLNGSRLAAPTFYHADPNAGTTASIFANFNAISATSDTTQPRVLSEWVAGTKDLSPAGFREMYYVVTIKADPEVLKLMREIFFEDVVAIADLPGCQPTFVTQGITTPQLQQMQKNGGNALGLTPGRGPLFILQLCTMWSRASDDDAVHRFMSDVLTKVTDAAKAKGVFDRFVYMNYASQFQNVVASYGEENKARLKTVAEKYDPQGVFQKLQPGGFKLDRAPNPDERYYSN